MKRRTRSATLWEKRIPSTGNSKIPEVGTQSAYSRHSQKAACLEWSKEPAQKRAYELRLEVRVVFYVWWETTGVFWTGQ